MKAMVVRSVRPMRSSSNSAQSSEPSVCAFNFTLSLPGSLSEHCTQREAYAFYSDKFQCEAGLENQHDQFHNLLLVLTALHLIALYDKLYAAHRQLYFELIPLVQSFHSFESSKDVV